jgi:mono/diheme cytochrome c family protein
MSADGKIAAHSRGWVSGVLTLAFLFGLGSPVGTADAAPDGRSLYRRHCASCHGASGEGNGPDALIFAARPRNLREGFLDKYATDDLIKRVRNGRALQLALDLPALKARADEVESIVAHMRRLPSVNWRRIEVGWELYVDRCEPCHGEYGTPPAALPPGARSPRDLSAPAFQQSLSDAELQEAVRHGRHHMPGLVPRITEAEATELTRFVRLLSPGFTLYTRHCTACHGDDGRGVGSLGEARPMPTVVFDRAYFSRRRPEDIRDAVWHMLGEQKPAMPHFRWTLSEAQARAIVEYLKRTEAPRSK